ncbi:MAG: ABC transporter ATP-binding protein [Planctomycetota bacterium]|nr:ABC transporter ATP-binding protein [Planctomycetota bacterium]
MLRDIPESRTGGLLKEVVQGMLSELSVRLEVPTEIAKIQEAINDTLLDALPDHGDALTVAIMRAANSIGIRLAPVDLSPSDVWELLMDGFSIAVVQRTESNQKTWVFSGIAARHTECSLIQANGRSSESISRSRIKSIIESVEAPLFFAAQRSLECQSIASNTVVDQDDLHRVSNDIRDHHHHEHEHISPQRRMMRFLKFEARDIWSLVIFGFVVGVLDLATPLAVEQMVTTIGFASLTQPLVWLAILLFGILTLSATIKGLQFFIVEILQRRIFVRIVGDLSERLPRLERAAMDGIHGPEMANRFFDVMTIQKSTASLLVEGLSLIIQTLTGLLLLALYSPFLLAFDIVLLIAMTGLLYLLGRSAVRTAIEESLVKYRVAHWLQDVIGNPTAFQVHGGGELVLDRANRLTVEYLDARRKHFIVLMRQTLFALLLYAVSISALLSLGVWLVLSGSLTIGQLVASVSVVVVIVGAFAKIGKSLESFYDLMSAVDKVGHLIDLPTLPPSRALDAGIGPVEVRFRSLKVRGGGHHAIPIGELTIQSGQRYAIVGEGECGKSILMQTLCGLRPPDGGLAEIGGIDSREVNRFADGSMVSIASDPEIFRGTLAENLSLNRISVTSAEVRSALQAVELWDEALSLPQGLETVLQSGGYPLSSSQAMRLMIARAIATRPRLLLIDGVLDRLPPKMRSRIWDRLSDQRQPWTILLSTHDEGIIDQCDGQLNLLANKAGH